MSTSTVVISTQEKNKNREREWEGEGERKWPPNRALDKTYTSQTKCVFKDPQNTTEESQL